MTYALFARSKNVNFLQMMNVKKVFSVKGYKRIQVNLAKAKIHSLLNSKKLKNPSKIKILRLHKSKR